MRNCWGRMIAEEISINISYFISVFNIIMPIQLKDSSSSNIPAYGFSPSLLSNDSLPGISSSLESNVVGFHSPGASISVIPPTAWMITGRMEGCTAVLEKKVVYLGMISMWYRQLMTLPLVEG